MDESLGSPQLHGLFYPSESTNFYFEMDKKQVTNGWKFNNSVLDFVLWNNISTVLFLLIKYVH